MAQCKRCSKSGWFLKLQSGLCSECNKMILFVHMNDFRMLRDCLSLIQNSENAEVILRRIDIALEHLNKISNEYEFLENSFLKEFGDSKDYYIQRLLDVKNDVRFSGVKPIKKYGKELHKLINVIFEKIEIISSGEIVNKLEYLSNLAFNLYRNNQYEEAIAVYPSYIECLKSSIFHLHRLYFVQVNFIQCLYKFRNDEKYREILFDTCFYNISVFHDLRDKLNVHMIPYCKSYHYLIQLYQINEEFDKALKICDKAILAGLLHQSQGGYQGIKERILKKMAKIN